MKCLPKDLGELVVVWSIGLLFYIMLILIGENIWSWML